METQVLIFFTGVSINTDTNVGIDTIDTLDRFAHPYRLVGQRSMWAHGMTTTVSDRLYLAFI